MPDQPSLLIPAKKYTPAPGRFRWPRKAVLASPRSADLLPLRQLAGDLAGARVEQSTAPATVRIVRDAGVDGAEAYRLAVSADGVEIRAAGDAGAYYGVQTLRELLAAGGRELACCRIADSPDFARRGVYHDVSRGKVPTLRTLKELVEQLARWKVNEFQLYVENVFTFRRHPAIGEGYSPLTPEELLALQEHAKSHHVRLVGSFASFGHLEKVLELTEYRPLSEYADKPSGTLCPTDPRSIRLLEELYEEYAPLFEAVDFNICGDETWDLGKGRSKRRADKIGVGPLYREFLLKVHRLCRRHGKRMNMWADIVLQHPEVLGDWPRDVVMLNWDYHPQGGLIARTREITDRGLPCMVCPGTNAWGSHGSRLRMGQENIRAFAAEGLRRGAEGLLNTDWGDGGHRNMLAVSLANFAYGAAASWNLAGLDDRGFLDRFCRHTFGRDAEKLAGPIATLGSTDEALHLPYANSGPTYWCLWAPLDTLQAAQEKFDAKSVALQDAHARRLDALRWPSPEKAPTPFLADTYAEFALAAHLDAFACRWLSAIKHVTGGKRPPGLKGLASQARDVSSHLAAVWRRRNKPSRLFEIQATLKALAKSCGRR